MKGIEGSFQITAPWLQDAKKNWGTSLYGRGSAGLINKFIFLHLLKLINYRIPRLFSKIVACSFVRFFR